MSTVMERTVSTARMKPEPELYVHEIEIPLEPRPGEENGELLQPPVLRRLVAARDKLRAEAPLQFTVRRYGGLTPKEIDQVHEHQGRILAATFMDCRAFPTVGRQLVTFAICRWGLTPKWFASITQELERRAPGTIPRWRADISRNAEPIEAPSYLGPR